MDWKLSERIRKHCHAPGETLTGRDREENGELREGNGINRRFLGEPLRVVLLMCSDFAWCFCVPFVLFWFWQAAMAWQCPDGTFRDCLGLAGMIVIINSISKCYHGNVLNPGAALNRVEEIRRLSFGVFGAYCFGYLSLLLNGRGGIYPLLPLIAALIATIIGFPLTRFAARYFMKKTKIGQIRVFIAGAGRTAQMVGEELEVSTYYGYEVIGYFDDDESRKDVCIHGKKWLGRISDAPRLAKKYNVHAIICCLPPIALPRITRSYTRTFEHVLVIPSNGILPITAVYPTLIGFISGFEYQNRILLAVPRIVKRIAELGMSICCMILLLPLFGVLAVLVKLSSAGPVFYTAKRLGFGGREINVFKFRTMYQDADARLESLLEENPALKEEWEKKFKLYNDPRVTKIGHFLRRTSLDELPQFINVLRGEMALIGPRPIVQDEVKYYGEAYEFFKRVRPGITGLWQVSGRSGTSYDQRVALDMFYVMNWSFWLDWFILWKTVLVVFMRKGSC